MLGSILAGRPQRLLMLCMRGRARFPPFCFELAERGFLSARKGRQLLPRGTDEMGEDLQEGLPTTPALRSLENQL